MKDKEIKSELDRLWFGLFGVAIFFTILLILINFDHERIDDLENKFNVTNNGVWYSLDMRQAQCDFGNQSACESLYGKRNQTIWIGITNDTQDFLYPAWSFKLNNTEVVRITDFQKPQFNITINNDYCKQVNQSFYVCDWSGQ